MPIVVSAERSNERLVKHKVGPNARAGLTYEKKVFTALQRTLGSGKFILEHTPWFRYKFHSDLTWSYCSPDIIIHDLEEDFLIIAEIKLSWVPLAAEKLRDLYCPVISRALELPTKPLIICKNLVPGSPTPSSRMSLSLLSRNPLYLWRDTNDPIIF